MEPFELHRGDYLGEPHPSRNMSDQPTRQIAADVAGGAVAERDWSSAHLSPAAAPVFSGLAERFGEAANEAEDEDHNAAAVLPTGGPGAARCKMELRRVIGRRLRAARALSGLDQGQAAALLGYEGSQTQLALWELGRRLVPLDRLVAAAEVYGVSVDFLVGVSNEPERDTHLALRTATLRAVRSMLTAATEGAIGLFERHAELLGPDAANLAQVVEAGQALQDAVAVVVRHADFDDLRGGASLVRCVADFEREIGIVRRRLAGHRAAGDDLKAELRRTMA